MDEMELKSLATKIIRELWPSVRINQHNLSPDVADYVFAVFAAAKEGHQQVKILAPLVTPATSWRGIAVKLIQMVVKYVDKDRNWGLAVRAAVSTHARAIQAAMDFGSDVYPLKFN